MFRVIHFCLRMCLKALEICLKEYGLNPAHFLTAAGLAWDACLKKTKVELELLTDTNMLLMVENGIRGGICQATHKYAKANNKYMKNYDKNIESSYLVFFLHGWAMSQRLLTNGFKWVEKKRLSNFNKTL